MKKILFILVMCLLCVRCVVATVDFPYYINLSSLPFNITELIPIGAEINSSINFTYGDYVSGTDGVIFNDSVYDFYVDILVPDTVGIGNYTSTIYIIGNYTDNITFGFFVLNDTIPTTEYVQITHNWFEYTFCDYSLPLNITKEIVVDGYPGQTIYASYDDSFFDFESPFIVGSDGYVKVNVLATLFNLSSGIYTKVIDFSVSEKEFSNVTFTFIINDCATPLTQCDDLYDVMNELCTKANKSITGVLECKSAQIDYDTCMYEAMVDASEKITINNTIIEYVNTTQYEPVLRLEDKGLIDILRGLPLTISQLIANDRARSKDTGILIDKVNNSVERVDNMLDEVDERVDKRTASLLQDNMLKTNAIKNYDNKYVKKSTIGWRIFWLLFMVGCILLYKGYQENYLW